MPKPGKPNILWICTDQQRWDTISYLGFPGARTPYIDNVAKSGVAFRNAYCQSPICTPSRASFLTGMYPIAHQVHRNGNVQFPEHLPLLPRMFKSAGYRTGLIGKLHLSRAQGIVEKRPDDGYDEFYWSQHPDPDWKEGHDYQEWLRAKGVNPYELFADQKGAVRRGVPSALHQTTWAGERAISFIKRNASAPWFLSINVYDPHPPFDPPAEYLKRFDAKDMPAPLFRASDLEHQKRFSGVDQQARKAVDPRHDEEDNDFLERTVDNTGPGSHDHDQPPQQFNARQLRAAYHAMIAQIDDMIGKLLETLRSTGQLADTLIVFMSDHGEMLGDHGLLYKGCRFYEGLVHVPLIMSCPGRLIGGVVSNALVELVDLPPTILEFAGIPIPSVMQGRSLLPPLEGRAEPDRHKPYVLSEYFDALQFESSVGSRASMFFDGRYKLCVYHDAGIGELFDHQSDPNEFEDLWHDPASEPVKCRLLNQHFNAMMCVSGTGPERTADY